MLATSNANKAKEKTAEWTVFIRHVADGHGRRTQERERDLVKNWAQKPKVQSKGPKKGHPKKKKKKEKKKGKKSVHTKCTYALWKKLC